ncbi:MAG: alpha/beta fold hydrolase [Actinomycetota bacterium]
MIPEPRLADGLAWREAGPSDAPPVLLLHGFPTSSLLWRGFLPALAPPMRAIAPDLFGGGASAAPEDPSTAGQAAAVGRLLDRLGVDRCAIVAHGHGCAIAHAIAATRDVGALVLLDAPDDPIAWPDAIAGADVGLGIVEALRSGLGYPARVPVEIVEAYAAPYVADPERFRRATRALAVPTGVRTAVSPEVPTLLLWGEDDAYVPVADAEAIAEAHPGATLAVLPGCGHFLPEDASEAIVPIVLDYLRGRYLGIVHRHDPGPVEVFLGRRPPAEAERMDT